MKRPRAAGIMARAGAVPFSGLLGAVLAIPLLAGPAGAQQPLAQAGGDLPVRAVRQIEALLAAKAQRTPAQRKVSSQFLEAQRTTAQRAVNSQPLDEQRTPTQRTMNSQLLDALRTPLREPPAAGTALLQATDPYAKDERVMVDIRADVTPAVLARIQSLGGTVINSVPRYQSIRARLPLAALEPLATLEAVQFIRPADEPILEQPLERSAVARAVAATSKVDTSEGDVAHQANVARQTYTVDGTGIGIGVISDGVDTLADQQATGDVPAPVMVLPGQEGGSFDLACGGRSSGTEGTAMFEIVHDLAPGADLFFADGGGGRAQMAQNIEDLCSAGANIIVDDIGYLGASAFQDDVIAQAISAAAANGCFYFSSAGNAGNLNDATAGVWEGDFVSGGMLSLNGINSGAVVHDFGGGVTGNRIKTNSTRPIILQWADPVDGSANDYDLFLIDADDNVLASSTSTQDGTQDPIEYIGGSCSNDREDNRLVIVKNSGAEDRYVRLNYARGGLEIATAGQTFGHSASKDAIGVAAVDVGDAGGAGGVFDGTESVETFSSDGLRRIFFEADGTPITAGNFLASTDGGRVLQKPDLAAADGVSTSTPGFSTFRGTSAAAPHPAAIAALMLEAAGGPANVTPAALRTAMTGAALDIEATGVDRDSGAGIVMAPGAVDAVDVAVADRNGAPTVSGTISDRTFAPGDAALTIDLTSVFSDPDNDTLTYTVWSSDNARLSVSAVTGTSFTLTPVSPGRMVVAVVAADPEGLIAVLTFGVTVTVGNRDYDSDDDGLIDVGNLAQLNAMRYDLNGDGSTDEPANWSKYHLAFVEGSWDMGCLDGCIGYELTTNLDFDTDGDGDVDSGDAYWNNGAGWAPIPNFSSNVSRFATIFEGNGRTITNLFIDSSENNIGLFGATGSSAVIRNLEMVSVQVTGTDDVGGLVGSNGGAVSGSFTTGKVSGDDDVGGLVGANLSDGAVSASYSTVQVTGDDRIGGTAGLNNGEVRAAYATGRVVGGSLVGGLIGWNTGEVNISYATGLVSSRSTVGGLVGRNGGGGNITDSYWDSDTSGHTTGSNGQAKNSEELQLPTTASDIYLNWNVDLDGNGMNDDPWDFGTSGQYPVLSVDTNGAGGATWQEFGQQLRTSPVLMTTTALGRVTLTWSEVSSAVYNLYRTSGTTVAILSENTSSRSYVDTDVTAGATYVYQVAAVINGGEASRSGQVSVVAPTPGMLPTVILQLMPTSISEDGGSSTVTARLSPVSTETTTVTVSATALSPAVAGDFSLSSNKTLTIGAGQSASTGTVTITANNNGVDAPNKTVMVTGTATNNAGVTGPSDVTLTIRDDDATPVITTAALIPVAENETMVATLLATDEDDRTEDLVWDITGGNDRSQFTLMGGGRLAFTAAKDYEEPDDSNGDGDYEVTVQVSDGFNAVEVAFTVRLQDVDDTAPTVSRVAITSDPGTDRTYAVDDEIQVTVTFSETVVVTRTPRMRLRVGSRNRTAGYLRGSGAAALVFSYEVALGDEDTDGVSIAAGRIDRNGGTIKDEADNDAVLDHEAVAPQAGHKVDGVRPAFLSAAVDDSSLTLTYGEALDGGSRPGTGDFTVEVGGTGRSVSAVSVSGSVVTLTLDPAVEHGDTGIRVNYSPGTRPIRDAVGNDALALSNRSVTNTTGAPNTAPEITSPGSFDVPENQALVRRLVARDTDPGDEVTSWEIVGGADRGRFSVASDTGELSFRTAPDFEAPGDNEYEVTVEVRSGAGARELEAEQTFTVRVTDEREPPGIPEAPTFSGETAESMTVNWSEPENTGPAITDYDVRYREKGTGRFTDGGHEGPGLTVMIEDLKPGTVYEVQVRATNDEGTSDWSESGEGMTVTPLTVEIMSGTEPPVEGPFTVRFSFSETVRGFTQAAIESGQNPACSDDQNNPVFCDPGIGRLDTVDDRVFTTTVTPRTDRVAHNYTLTLTMSRGAVRSSVENKPNEEGTLEVRVAPPGVTVPISSLGLTASAGNAGVRLSWNRPTEDGGSAIIRYEYRFAAAGEDFSAWENVGAGTRRVTVGGLINGREYVFEVRAVNALGKGETETVSATPDIVAPPPPRPPPPRPPASNRPMADAGPDQTGVREGALVTLDGSGSSDPDDDPLKYRWNQYRGERVALSSRDVVNPTFTAPRELTADVVLSFRLLVTDPSGRFDSDTVTVTVEQGTSPPQTGDQIYYFPHLAVGASWQTTITYINYSREEVTCQTDFISDHGTPLMVSFAELGMVDSRTDVLPPGGSVHQETDVALSAPLAPGWARANCTGLVQASLLFRLHNSEGAPTAEAGVNAATVPATRFVTFAEQGEGKNGTGVAYANPSATAALVTFTARDADGEVLASEDLMLPPNWHGAQNMPTLFDLSSFTGSLEVTSTEPIVSLSLNAEAAPVFSSLPPGELDASAQGSTTYYFPHLAVGDNWQTTITYINYSREEVSCQTDFISDHGSPLMVSFAELGMVDSRTDVLPPGGSVHQETDVALSAPLAPGWARATCTGLVQASLLFRLHNSEGAPTAEAGVNAATVPATRFVTFAEQGEGKNGTGVAYANPSDTAALVTFTARDADGEVLVIEDLMLPPNWHGAQNMPTLFDLSSFTGSLEVTSTEPIVSLSLNAEAAPVFSSLPPGELEAAAQ